MSSAGWLGLASAAVNWYSSREAAKEKKKEAQAASKSQALNTFRIPYMSEMLNPLISYILQNEQQVFENRMKGYGAKATDFSAFAQLLAGISPGYSGVGVGGSSGSAPYGPSGPPGGAGQAPNYGYYGQPPMNQATERGAIDKGRKGNDVKPQQAAGGVYGWSGGGAQDPAIGQQTVLPNGVPATTYNGQLPFPYGGFAGYMDSSGQIHNMPAWGNQALKWGVGFEIPHSESQIGAGPAATDAQFAQYFGPQSGFSAGMTPQAQGPQQFYDAQGRYVGSISQSPANNGSSYHPWSEAGNYGLGMGTNAGGGYGSTGSSGYYDYLSSIGNAY